MHFTSAFPVTNKLTLLHSSSIRWQCCHSWLLVVQSVTIANLTNVCLFFLPFLLTSLYYNYYAQIMCPNNIQNYPKQGKTESESSIQILCTSVKPVYLLIYTVCSESNQPRCHILWTKPQCGSNSKLCIIIGSQTGTAGILTHCLITVVTLCIMSFWAVTWSCRSARRLHVLLSEKCKPSMVQGKESWKTHSQ